VGRDVQGLVIREHRCTGFEVQCIQEPVHIACDTVPAETTLALPPGSSSQHLTDDMYVQHLNGHAWSVQQSSTLSLHSYVSVCLLWLGLTPHLSIRRCS
jgi:hypothetical protein